MVATRRTRSAAAADAATPAVSDDGNVAKSAGLSAATGDGDQDTPPSKTTSIPAPAKNAASDCDGDNEGGPRKRPRTEDTSADTDTNAGKGVENGQDVADSNEASAEMELDDDEKEQQPDAEDDSADADAGDEANDEASEEEEEADEIEEYDESDDEVQIMSPPPKSQSQSQHSVSSSQQSGAAAGATNSDGTDDDEIQVESCNVMNPTVHYAHTRDMCGVHKFDKAGKDADLNRLHCPKCYCFVCDVEADQCSEWDEHCHANSQDVTWKAIRQMKKNQAAGGSGGAAAIASPNGTGGGNVIVLDSDDGTSPAGVASAAASRRRMQMVAAASAAAANQQRARERMEVLANIMGGSVAPVVMPPGLATGYDVSGAARSAALAAAAAATAPVGRTKEVTDLVAEALGGAVNGGRSASTGVRDGEGFAGGERRTKTREQMRITEVLSENFRKVLTLTAGAHGADGGGAAAASAPSTASLSTAQSRRKMEGDIPQLGLHGSFFVEGIKIGWPYPMVMQPQRQMAIHLIKALKNRRHVVLESPTGTGKSAAILCSALAWQRYHAKTAEGRTDTPRIIYCSRTHSQVAQMVASLKKTPYRPRMAILGSRERMCIHKDLRPRAKAEKNSDKNLNVNNECRVRVRNTEKYRKQMWRSETQGYDDDEPPVDVTGDRASDATAGPQQGEAAAEAADDANDDGFRSKNRKMCPHYRQLTSNRVAALAHSMFTPNEKAVECCSLGGEQTKFGAHNIEDLVNFGVTPHTLSGVAIYRGNTSTVGLQLSEAPGSGCCTIGKVKEGAAKIEGTIREGDRLTNFNGEDIRDLPLAEVASRFRNASQDPVTLDVIRGDVGETDDDDYSPHSACPYYLSQILAKNAELVFAPYNYVLEPAIRNAMGIELEGSIVVLDEAHNVEDTLRESGSCKLGEFELCELLLVMSNYSTMEKHHANLIKVNHPGTAIPIPGNEYAASGRGGDVPDGSMYISDVAHYILLFLERIIEFLRSSRDRFESNPGNKGADAAIREWRKFHSPDDKEFEVTYDGPTGTGVGGKAVGCKPFFDRIQLRQDELEQVLAYAEALSEHVRGRSEEQGERSMNQMDRLLELVVKFAAASQKPEHFYIASVVAPNGSFAHAAGDDDEAGDGASSRFKKKPKQLPYAPPRTQAYPDRLVNPCSHDLCRRRSAGNAFNVVRHGSYCNGSTPRWEATLVLNLLSPGLPMRELADQCRTVVLASGSLAPLPSLCGELNLFPPKDGTQNVKPSATSDAKVGTVTSTSTEVDLEKYGRLQVQPKPLEANHVVNLPKQLLAVSVGHFPDGTPLSVKYANYSKPGFIGKLGDAIASIIESIPTGGVLVFLPSYSFLRKCANTWNPNNSRRRQFRFGSQYEEESDVWDRILASKGRIIVEETGSQEKFEAARNDYNNTVRSSGSCVLFAVYRGKMSEGVSFNDDYARGVICVGLPLPNSYDMSIKAKKSYNNEQRRLRNRTNLLPGDDWYQQQAHRAIAQALGRCIRHAGDYGTIVLLDSRHCDDGSPSLDGVCSAHRQLPKWMRHHVRNLVKGRRGGMGAMEQFLSSADNKFIQGGWNGLANEMKRFFREAKPYAASVLAGHQAKLERARERDQKAQGRKFDNKTGTWSSSTKGSTMPSSSSAMTVTSTAAAAAAPTAAVSTTVAPNTAAGTSSTSASTSISTTSAASLTPSNNREGETSSMAVPPAAASAAANTSQTGQPSSSISANPYVSQQAKKASAAPKSQYLSSRERIQRALPPKKAPNTLQALFSRQRSAATVETGGNGEVAARTPAAQQPQSQSETLTAPSPAVGINLGSALKATASTVPVSASVGATTQPVAPLPPPSQAEEENLCIICEEATKRVVLLPCKHLCLCGPCSKLEQVTDCPMCRTKISDRMEVFM